MACAPGPAGSAGRQILARCDEGRFPRKTANSIWHMGCVSLGMTRTLCHRFLAPLPTRDCNWRSCSPCSLRRRLIKDIADVEGIRDNQLVGYGLVVGPQRHRRQADSAVFTRQSLIGMLERLGVNTRDQETKLQTKNVAAVDGDCQPPRLRPLSAAGSTSRSPPSATPRTSPAARWSRRCSPPTARATPSPRAPSPPAPSPPAAPLRRSPATSPPPAHRQRRHRRARGRLPALHQDRDRPAYPDLTTARRIATAINTALGGNAARATDPRTVALDPSATSSRRSLYRGPPRSARQRRRRRHRRGLRHHRHGRQRPHQHGRHRPGQPHHPRHRDAQASEPAPSPTAPPSPRREQHELNQGT
jgi:hypothetical protein